MLQHIINHHPVGLEGTEPVLHVTLLEHSEGAEDETGRLHLDLRDMGQAEAGETLLALVWDEAYHDPGEGQGPTLPPLLSVDIIGARPAVDGNVPAHLTKKKKRHIFTLK